MRQNLPSTNEPNHPTLLCRLLSEVSSQFMHHSGSDFHQLIESAQRTVCEALQLDRSTLWLFSDDGTEMALSTYWQQPDCPPLRRNFVTRGNLPWAEQEIRNGRPFRFSSLSDLPPEADRDRDILRQHGTKSNVTFPLMIRGQTFGALAFATIHTERDWSEEEIASLSLLSQLFSHVIGASRAERRTQQLHNEIQRASRAAQIGELAASLVHEINQPLTTILSNAQAARRFLTAGSSDTREILAILDDIIEADKRVTALVHNLRDMLGETPARREPLCLNELVTDACAAFSKDQDNHGIRLHFTPTRPPTHIHAARLEIHQLLANLLANACHAMLDTPAEHRRIHIKTLSENGTIHLYVRDHGHGIAPEHIDRVFEPFHSTRKDGLGMGLAICRRIVERHGGSIKATNHADGGAVFTCSLPLHHHDGMRPWSDAQPDS